MCHWNSGVCRRSNAGCDAGNYLERHRSIVHGLRFFTPASEHERVAALESDDSLTLSRQSHQQLIDLVLRDRIFGAPALADVIQLGSSGLACTAWKQGRIGESIVNDGVGRFD